LSFISKDTIDSIHIQDNVIRIFAIHQTNSFMPKTKPDKKPKPSLSQDPHSTKQSREKVLETAIGHEVKNLRLQHGIKVAELAKATGLSVGMLSKIENGLISPSLTTLQTLASALSVPLTCAADIIFQKL